jgi:putative transposase
MNVHKNARLTPIGRERLVRLVESGETPKAVGEAVGVCPRTVGKWVERYRREGVAGLQDRSREACKQLGLKHIRTKPYIPKTNGKAERFIQTCLREWAYAKAYPNSDQRAAELPAWLHQYNWHRPHGGLKSKTPISRLGLSEDNLLRLHS